MKKLVKLASIIMVSMMAVGMLSGCSSNEKLQGETPAAESSGTENIKETPKTNYPEKQISLVVPYSPGGASDTVARIFAQELEKIVGKPVIVSNKTGASGAVGLEFVKNSKADGYTIAYMPVESTMISSLGFTDLTSDDFTFIGRAMTIPAAVTVSKDAPWNTLEEFLIYAKENPNKVQVGNSGTGSIWHVAAAELEQASGAKFIHVPFDGAAPAIAALMGGNIDAVTVSPSEVKSNVDAGEFKVLAVLGEGHSSVVPDVKTAKEQGVDVEAQGWGGFAVPKDTPAEVVAVLNAAAEKAINTQTLKDLLAERGFEFAYLSGTDMDDYAKEQLTLFQELIPSLNIVQK